MSKVDTDAAKHFALCMRQPSTGGKALGPHTQVIVSDVEGYTTVYMVLHGHCIAKAVTAREVINITLAGYNTPTTKARLNALLRMVLPVERRATINNNRGKPYLNARIPGGSSDDWESIPMDPDGWYTVRIANWVPGNSALRTEAV